MTLGEKQELFARKQAEWLLEILDAHPTWGLRHGEGRIFQNGPDGKGRKVKKLGVTWFVKDAVHIEGSTHYSGVGQDWVLTVDGQVITRGDHPAWRTCGEAWEKKHPLCRWGGRFNDANHFSMVHEGVS